MKRIIITLVLLIGYSGLSQNILHNTGNLKIFDGGQMGFHIDLANDGSFDQNEGLAGFYSNDARTISGAFRPIFHDIEVLTTNDLMLDVGIGVTNNANFILGDVYTPRNSLDITIDFINDAFYSGETNTTKVDGYSAITNKSNFIFPIGYGDKIRPLELNSENTNQTAKSGYFYEDPNAPTSFIGNYDTDIKADILTDVGYHEFWDLDGSELSKVKLTWDLDSQVDTFVDEIENIRVVGWNTNNNLWENLGNTAMFGDFNSGSVTSDIFIPDDYAIITFGNSLSLKNITLENYFLSPNGDGINDFLHLKAVAISPNNNLTVFNRWGRKVYEKDGYDNSFDGTANVKMVVQESKKLPDGVYFYIIDLKDINIKHQGFLYIGK